MVHSISRHRSGDPEPSAFGIEPFIEKVDLAGRVVYRNREVVQGGARGVLRGGTSFPFCPNYVLNGCTLDLCTDPLVSALVFGLIKRFVRSCD